MSTFKNANAACLSCLFPPMSDVEFKKSPCCMLLSFLLQCQMSLKAVPYDAMLYIHDTMVCSKPPMMQQTRMQCFAMHVGNFAPCFGISPLFIVQFSNGFQHNDGHLMSLYLIRLTQIILYAITAMEIAGEYGNIPL